MGARGIIQSGIICVAGLLRVIGSRGIIQSDITCTAGLLESYGPGI